MANAPKTTTAPAKQESGNAGNLFASLAIIICLVIGFLVYKYVMGDPSNFVDGNVENRPLPGNYLGMVYHAGYVVPVLLGLFLMVWVFSIERLIVISKASGTGNVGNFVRKVQGLLRSGNIDNAIQECDKQKGSVANVIKAGLLKYKDVEAHPGLDTEKSVLAIQKEIEEATTLEMPMLEKNLTVIATLVSIGTLTGLLGTVTGMIKAFSALATGGTPDSAQLANGISEALINTATGIGTSTIAIIFYNILTSKIDTLTYSIDEAGFSIVQTYAANHK
ncbi:MULTISPECIES: MotA/TolQ/ExbB proton channel family protein [Sphingobacterium]|uniref:Flagellar motor protein MotA n=1 Tax=Sphingobacterium cellulitidis TaxID=1768011 RepID=A0A8H9G355_9SPHI|nr:MULTISPECIES: MotA/TolQ/ExbB proton channel family protein [Sphingobacterium]MBA8988656.1 biopolymer transport protein ExbB [Sphingobacterium soli]OYD41932.1 flagellar motor protein MotA [Sphingobacterium cellulitidis]OYD44806.1 flagellar motor protein MotA [Sphingobacterium cellulitidis]WFB63346.1 MotA/TolQ/ExbB proton channel family protein [Sphingobacterium sp. WM]GGE34572.1 flagellar motor protein MotA [Sphingobacterium soli]